MTALAEVFERLASDPSFADQVRSDPATALREFKLSPGELRRIEQAIDASFPTPD
jgi:hypothetical protein